MINTLSDKIIFGVVAHLIADWLLQNDWMARNKHKPGIASWIHAGIHYFLLLFVFEWSHLAIPFINTALFVALSHMLIDFRFPFPLDLWQKFYRQTREGEFVLHVRIWADQVLHITVITLAASLEEIFL